MYWFERNCYSPPRPEIRRLAIAAAVLLVFSALWHWGPPLVLRYAAGLSLGWPGRTDLVRDALARGLARSKAATLTPNTIIWARNSPGGDYVIWNERTALGRPPVHPRERFLHRSHFADHRLRYQGRYTRIRMLTARTSAGDMDGDGKWELVLGTTPTNVYGKIGTAPRPAARQKRFAVIRLGPESNEVVWAGLVNSSLPEDKETRIVPLFRDEDGDGIQELVFITKKKLPRPKQGFEPPETVAVFEWDRPGGSLRARFLAPHSGLVAWTPPEFPPLRVPRDRALDGAISQALKELDIPDPVELNP